MSNMCNVITGITEELSFWHIASVVGTQDKLCHTNTKVVPKKKINKKNVYPESFNKIATELKSLKQWKTS